MALNIIGLNILVKRQRLSEWNFYFLFIFWPCHASCGILVPQPGIEPGPSAMKVQSPNRWTARELPGYFLKVTLLYSTYEIDQ